jgi:hypothetical protein
VTNIKEKFDLNIGSIAAAAELGIANVSYKITGIGIGFSGFLTVLGGIDPFGMLTLDAATKMSRTIFNKDNFAAKLNAANKASGGTVMSSVPLEVLLRRSFGNAGESIPQSVVFGIRSIRNGLKLDRALEDGAASGFDQRSIQKAYSLIFQSSDPTLPPNNSQARDAQKWLDLQMV